MHLNRRLGIAAGATLLLTASAFGQDRKDRIDVQHYTIKADINPNTQSLTATVQVRFVPVDDTVSSAAFELHNGLNVSRVTTGDGQPVPASRSRQDSSITVNFPTPLAKGTAGTLVFEYDGRLTGSEADSPVYGIKFASINPEFAYLMYPSRWFPVNEYTADRYTANIEVKAPAEYKVVGAGDFTSAAFPGSIALVKGDGVRSGNATFYFRGEQENMVTAYGEELGKLMVFFTDLYGLPPSANLTVVETENGTPNGYSGPGVLFLSPRGIGTQVNQRLLANQVARQWWGGLVSPTTRNHLWITNGMARYSEILWLEHLSGASAMEAELRDVYVEALTVDNPPLGQAARLEDYSPEFWAATAGKGAAVLNMLRHVIGDDVFKKTIKAVPEKYAWKEISTEEVRQMAEAASNENLQGFFQQWINSTGAPQFQLEYTIFRTQKGFRVMGKVSQDLDLFRMPVDVKIETEGNPEEKRIEVVGTSSEFVIETFGKPKNVTIDPDNQVLRYNDNMRVAVAIRRGEQFAELGEFGEALKEYQQALEVNRNSSLAHYRVAEVFFLQNNYQSAANEFREALNGDLEPAWTEVWAHINLGKIFDLTGQRERAVNEYNQALRTKDNTQGALEEAAKFLKQPYERQRAQN